MNTLCCLEIASCLAMTRVCEFVQVFRCSKLEQVNSPVVSDEDVLYFYTKQSYETSINNPDSIIDIAVCRM